jgi:hypothetical protein
VIRSSGSTAYFVAGASEPALLVDGRNVLASGSAAWKNLPDSSGLSGGAIAGIVIGIVVLLGFATLAVVWHQKAKGASLSAPTTPTPQSPSAAPHPPASARQLVECEAIPVAAPVVDTNTTAHITDLSMLQHTKSYAICDQGTFVGTEQSV